MYKGMLISFTETGKENESELKSWFVNEHTGDPRLKRFVIGPIHPQRARAVAAGAAADRRFGDGSRARRRDGGAAEADPVLRPRVQPRRRVLHPQLLPARARAAARDRRGQPGLHGLQRGAGARAPRPAGGAHPADGARPGRAREALSRGV